MNSKSQKAKKPRSQDIAEPGQSSPPGRNRGFVR